MEVAFHVMSLQNNMLQVCTKMYRFSYNCPDMFLTHL